MVHTAKRCSPPLQEQTPPPRPEAYPIPTQTSTREYFTFPASKSQDRVAPPQSQWLGFEEKPQVLADGNHSSAAIQVRGRPGCPPPPGRPERADGHSQHSL